jgi:1,5-anhydro-D-fructose reductase (1,5-anhydro-D-mannitol-forming)
LRLAGQEIVGVFSSSISRASNYATTNDLTRHTDRLDELLSWPVDAVYVSTTNDLHAAQTLAAIRARKNILCEKPLATSVAMASDIVDQARAHGVILATNHHIRASGVHEMIRRIVAEGRLGELYLARINHAVGLSERLRGWRLTGISQGGGVVWDQVVHDVDTLRADLQSDIVEVTALTSTLGMAAAGIEDISLCNFRFANGVVASTCQSYLVPFGRTSLEIHGSRGSLVATDVLRQDPIGDIVLTDSSGTHDIAVEDRENLYVKTIRRFELACQGIGQPFSTGEDGLEAVRGAAAVFVSAHEKRTVTF